MVDLGISVSSAIFSELPVPKRNTAARMVISFSSIIELLLNIRARVEFLPSQLLGSDFLAHCQAGHVTDFAKCIVEETTGVIHARDMFYSYQIKAVIEQLA